jgi:EmrB/QacA subfamily drug resistance transporter
MRKKIMIMISVASVLLFAALNMTIVGTSLPKIVAKIGGMEYFDWVFTIYMLTSSITAILVGKLSDIFGRKIFILIGILIFAVGSLLSGFSGNITQLIIFRGIQGFGGGMCMSISFATVGDLFSPRERGRWQGLLGATFGLASLIGPTLGGFIVDNYDWSWIFWVFLPFGFVAFACIFVLYPKADRRENESVDYLGSLVLTISIVALLLGFSWADNRYEWVSLQIIGLFALSLGSLALFIWIETKVKSPVIPLHLFRNSVFTLSNIIAFLLGVGMFSVIMYTPFFVQGVLGESATVSGLVELAMTIALVISSGVAGALITKTGKYKIMGIIGLSIMAVGFFLHSQLSADSSIWNVVLNLFVIGLGLGVTFPIFNLTVQNAVKHKFLGVATATSQLFRELGGTVGVAVMGSIMGTIIANKMGNTAIPTIPMPSGEMMEESMPEGGMPDMQATDPQILMDPELLDSIRGSLPEQALPMFEDFIVTLKDALSASLNGVFLFSIVIVVLTIAATILMKEIPLRTSNDDEEEVIQRELLTESGKI